MCRKERPAYLNVKKTTRLETAPAKSYASYISSFLSTSCMSVRTIDIHASVFTQRCKKDTPLHLGGYLEIEESGLRETVCSSVNF